jgi:hypothetical protein
MGAVRQTGAHLGPTGNRQMADDQVLNAPILMAGLRDADDKA